MPGWGGRPSDGGPETMSHIVENTWVGSRKQGPKGVKGAKGAKGDKGGRFRCVHQGSVVLYERGRGAEVDVTSAEPLDSYDVHIPLTGDGAVTMNRKGLFSVLGVVGPEQRGSTGRNGHSVNRILIIPRAAVDDALTVRLGEPPHEPLSFEPVLDNTAAPVQGWLELVGQLADFADSGLAARSPLATGHFEQLLVNGLLDVQPHTLSEAVAGRATAAVPRAVRRARDFCAGHAHEPISAADMARAAGVSVRSLREGFRQHLDTTPSAYLRGVRLGLVRRDLLAADDGRAAHNVTDVALRWGFTHLGRFTGHYRAAYGETPSQTLRTVRGSD
ncbi:AraC family transcriptional regulator [Streptomyces sp. NPDC090021]|uniref:AraC family transcriptional regulator n=1 Tax=Streptomyces sp. NPDC090021 TaxID=3365919 RepID=UPI003815F1B0